MEAQIKGQGVKKAFLKVKVHVIAKASAIDCFCKVMVERKQDLH